MFAVQRRIGWAYVAAAIAVMTRYDVAGLILGVFIADLVQRKRPWTAIRSAAIASAPLVIWLLLTALTWADRSDDHYLAQMAERQTFDLRSLWWPFMTVLDLDALRLPGTLFELDRHIRTAAMCGLVLAAIAGVFSRCRRCDPAVFAALAAFLCYVALHVVFPFQFQRFGFPMAPLVIILAAEGIRVVVTLLNPTNRISSATRTVALILLGSIAAFALIGEANGYAVRTGLRNPWSVTLAFLVAIALAVLWIAPV